MLYIYIPHNVIMKFMVLLSLLSFKVQQYDIHLTIVKWTSV